MQTLFRESAQNDLAMLADFAAKGNEVLLTENDKPLAKLVPLDEAEAWRRDIRKLRGLNRTFQISLMVVILFMVIIPAHGQWKRVNPLSTDSVQPTVLALTSFR